MKPLVDLLHIILCNSPHCYNMIEIKSRQTNICYYYLENDIAEGDTMEDHVKWEMIANSFKTQLGFNSDEETLEFVRSVIKLSQEFKKLTSDNPKRSDFIKLIME
jgi:hypothetical protein